MARQVVIDLGENEQLARDLAAGGVFVPGCEARLNEDCELVMRGGEEELVVTATVVWVGNGGAGLQIVGCDAAMKERIAALADPGGAAAAARAAEQEQEPELEQEQEPELEQDQEREQGLDAEGGAGGGESANGEAKGDSGEGEGEFVGRKIALNVHERLRGLTLAQQVKLAHSGLVSERIVLERMYGKNVWEALLRNPQLTGPEVARIARMGTLPRVLIEIIVSNGAWLQIPEVRRALLSNPRLGLDQILRVLRLLPKHELKLAALQTAYPFAVRDAARKMIRED